MFGVLQPQTLQLIPTFERECRLPYYLSLGTGLLSVILSDYLSSNWLYGNDIVTLFVIGPNSLAYTTGPGCDTPILSEMQIFHNYIRPHMGLDVKTPADLAGIQVEGENKWLTLIQNASQKKESGTKS